MSAVTYITLSIMQIIRKKIPILFISYLYTENVHIFYMHISTIFPLLVIVEKPLIHFTVMDFKFHSGNN